MKTPRLTILLLTVMAVGSSRAGGNGSRSALTDWQEKTDIAHLRDVNGGRTCAIDGQVEALAVVTDILDDAEPVSTSRLGWERVNLFNDLANLTIPYTGFEDDLLLAVMDRCFEREEPGIPPPTHLPPELVWSPRAEPCVLRFREFYLLSYEASGRDVFKALYNAHNLLKLLFRYRAIPNRSEGPGWLKDYAFIIGWRWNDGTASDRYYSGIRDLLHPALEDIRGDALPVDEEARVITPAYVEHSVPDLAGAWYHAFGSASGMYWSMVLCGDAPGPALALMWTAVYAEDGRYGPVHWLVDREEEPSFDELQFDCDIEGVVFGYLLRRRL
ncbi:MAG: hypothetical protein HQ559_03235 [Lentisphaerae bacterium]|nr:hypothetical protein [Lentisphaerota bacterium]